MSIFGTYDTWKTHAPEDEPGYWIGREFDDLAYDDDAEAAFYREAESLDIAATDAKALADDQLDEAGYRSPDDVEHIVPCGCDPGADDEDGCRHCGDTGWEIE